MAELIQGTAEWLDARCGKVTASRVADVLAVRRERQNRLRIASAI